MERRSSNDDKRYSVTNHNYNRSNSNEKKNWRDEDLDEEMEEIFHPPTEQCSIADLCSDGEVDGRIRYDENDYDLHRRESFQYHQPLHKLYHHKHRKSHSRKSIDESPSVMSKVPEERALEWPKEKEKASVDLMDVVSDNSRQANQVCYVTALGLKCCIFVKEIPYYPASAGMPEISEVDKHAKLFEENFAIENDFNTQFH